MSAPEVPRPGRGALLLYAVVRALVAGFCRLFWRLGVEGAEHLPAAGPFVLAPVHRSNLDTLVVAAVTRRRLRFMGKDSLWRNGLAGWFLTALGGFPVHRGTADREALRRCVQVLDGGEPLVLFPEGTRRAGPVVETIFDGAAYVAARTGVPLVPVGIGGSERAMPRGSKLIRPVRISVVIGPPLVPPAAEAGRPSRRVVRELSSRLQVDIQRLFDEAQKQATRP